MTQASAKNSVRYRTPKFLFVLLMVITSIRMTAVGQDTIATIPTTGPVRDLYGFEAGDSLVLFYVESNLKTGAGPKPKARWVTNDGRSHAVSYPFQPVGMLSGDQSIFFYALEEKDKVLGIWTTTQNKPVRKELETIPLEGRILSISTDSVLRVFLLNEKTGSTIDELEIRGNSVVSRRTYSLPMPIKSYLFKKTVVEYFADNPILNSFKGRASAKLIDQGSTLYLVIDRLADEPAGTQTFVFCISRLEGTVTFTAFRREDVPLTSYASKGRLCQHSIAKDQYSISMFDLNSHERLFSQTVKLADTSVEEADSVFSRYGSDGTVYNTYVTKPRIHPGSSPTLVAYPDSLGHTLIIGSYYNPKAMGAMPTPDLFGAAVFVITTAMWQAAEGPGISTYRFTTIPDGSKELVPTDPSIYLRNRIDLYEMSCQTYSGKRGMNVKSPYRRKFYMEADESIIGLYVMESESKYSIRVVKF